MKRNSLWDDIIVMLLYDLSSWMIIGGFNIILSHNEKRSDHTTGKLCKFCGKFVDSCNLQDLGFIGPPLPSKEEICLRGLIEH